MKIRKGFVSNSSSCSFVLGKNYMTDEQVKKFSRFINYLDESAYNRDAHIPDDLVQYIDDVYTLDGGPPFESDLYFFGEVDQSMTDPIHQYLKDIGVDKKYYELMS